MIVFIKVVHIIVSLFMIVVILLQAGKGAEMGAMFGGARSSSSYFGASGGIKEFRIMTVAAAVIFMVTSIILTISSSSKISGRGEIIDLTETEQPAPKAAANPLEAIPSDINDQGDEAAAPAADAKSAPVAPASNAAAPAAKPVAPAPAPAQ